MKSDLTLPGDPNLAPGAARCPGPSPQEIIDRDGDTVPPALRAQRYEFLGDADLPYQRLRSVVRTPRWQRHFLRLSLATRRTLAAAARAGSRAHTGSAAAYIMDADEGAVRATMQACDVLTLIHGHTHRPALHDFTLRGQPARRIVLGAWYEQGSLLRRDERGYDLQVLARGGPE